MQDGCCIYWVTYKEISGDAEFVERCRLHAVQWEIRVDLAFYAGLLNGVVPRLSLKHLALQRLQLTASARVWVCVCVGVGVCVCVWVYALCEEATNLEETTHSRLLLLHKSSPVNGFRQDIVSRPSVSRASCDHVTNWPLPLKVSRDTRRKWLLRLTSSDSPQPPYYVTHEILREEPEVLITKKPENRQTAAAGGQDRTGEERGIIFKHHH
ncbi:hypothetical protein RRG08_037118 [Elysia crispata]|uniref:Uncharacterized protein n=1 Tax=Elysia crispata TaxID=231223 RepID=A0AAE0Y4Z6_9GAST|nr:hypothetical protein RRG08_037118 [Elysia crispata]